MLLWGVLKSWTSCSASYHSDRSTIRTALCLNCRNIFLTHTGYHLSHVHPSQWTTCQSIYMIDSYWYLPITTSLLWAVSLRPVHTRGYLEVESRLLAGSRPGQPKRSHIRLLWVMFRWVKGCSTRVKGALAGRAARLAETLHQRKSH